MQNSNNTSLVKTNGNYPDPSVKYIVGIDIATKGESKMGVVKYKNGKIVSAKQMK